tara:strand:+ start:28678 stop:28872 length:195 start_codon:yes stop_codon:yes gene_type:complete
MKLVFALSLGVLLLGSLGSCKKNEVKTCTARSADGTAMYTVEGESVCDEQINKTAGEYCDCNGE